MNLHAHYQQLWESTSAQYKVGNFELDALLASPQDQRRGLTLVLRPQAAVKENIQKFLRELAPLEPEQYYYPSSDIHITALSIISCYPAFKLEQVNPQHYIALAEQALQHIKPFQVEFRGITASPSCVMVQGFPVGAGLQQLRENVRETFRTSHLQQSIDQRYALQTAHCTVLRFQEPPTQPQKFLEKLQENRERAFGKTLLQEVELVYNDWYQRAANTVTLAKFRL